MSYILEALKKSECIRQQGRVPDLASLPAGEPPAASTAGRLPLLAAAALLLALAVAGWWRPWQAPVAVATPRPVAEPAPSMPTVVPAPVTPATPDAPAGPALSAAPAAVPASEPAPRPTMQPLPAAQPKALPRRAEPTPMPLAAASGAAASGAVASGAAAPDTPLPAPPNRVLSFHELPPAVRERIPPLTVSGFSYAEQADLSMAVINDKVLRQGESAAPGLTLERVVSDGVVLGFAGYRFRPQR